MRLVTSGANPVELRQGVLAASGMIIEEIKKMARPVGKNEVRIMAFVACMGQSRVLVLVLVLVCVASGVQRPGRSECWSLIGTGRV